MITNKYTSFAEYQAAAKALRAQMDQANWKPDIVAAILRGGSVLAATIAYEFDIPMYCINWHTEEHSPADPITRRLNGSEAHFLFDMFNLDKKILLVDGIIDSGRTVMTLWDEWIREKPFNGLDPKLFVKIACLVYNTDQKLVKPDFWVDSFKRSEDKSYIKFWWEHDAAPPI